MGIKGRRKRERERQLRDQADGNEASDSDPETAGPPRKLKHSERFYMYDMDYLDRARDEIANRKVKNTAGETPGKSQARQKEQAIVGVETEASAHGPQFFAPSDAEAVSPDDVRRVSATRRRQQQAMRLAKGGVAAFSHGSLDLDPLLVAALDKEGFSVMTAIQQRAIPLSLAGHDLLAQAKTGSGKTLAFIVPILQQTLTAVRVTSRFVALVLAPTKELCVQTQQVAAKVTQHMRRDDGTAMHRVELVTGGTNVGEERRRVAASTIVVGTPGRVRDHVANNPIWTVRSSTQFLVLDEADRMLAEGFQRDVDAIIEALPAMRQALLFSATASKSVTELARLSLKRSPLVVDTQGDAPAALTGEDDEDAEQVGAAPPYMNFDNAIDSSPSAAAGDAAAVEGGLVPDTLRQVAQVVPIGDRLRALYQFVKRVAKSGAKAMVFCSTVASCQFHCMMMGAVGFHDSVLMLHGKMKHRQRLGTFQCFLDWPSGVLFCTDVAARGLDIPDVEWILQYDAPLDPTEYVHRIGRTARAGASGTAVLYLDRNELAFIPYLAKFGIKVEVAGAAALPDIQEKLEHVLQLDELVARAAVGACRAFVSAYQSHVLKSTFDASSLDLDDVARSFALTSVPGGLSVTPSGKPKDSVGKGTVAGQLKSLNKRKKASLQHFHREKTKAQWTADGVFVGVRKPSL